MRFASNDSERIVGVSNMPYEVTARHARVVCHALQSTTRRDHGAMNVIKMLIY